MRTNYVILLGIISVIVSAVISNYLTQRNNRINNEILIAELKKELANTNQTKVRATPSEQISIEKKQNELQAQINILEQINNR